MLPIEIYKIVLLVKMIKSNIKITHILLRKKNLHSIKTYGDFFSGKTGKIHLLIENKLDKIIYDHRNCTEKCRKV